MRPSRPTLAAFLAALAACSNPEHTNSFDPLTPPSLQAKATLQGVVTLEQTGPTLPPLDGILVSVPGIVSVTTDAQGRYALQGVPEGHYAVTATRAGYETGTAPELVVTLDDGDKTLPVPDIRLVASRGAIAGTYQLSGASASAGIVVTATEATSGVAFSTTTDSSGGFSLSSLPVGTYAVSARKDPDWVAVTTTGVVVSSNGIAPLPGSPVSLVPVATASIAGTALAEGATDHSGTLVTLSGVDFRGVSFGPLTALTDALGQYAFSALRAGSYQLAFSRTSYDVPGTIGVSLPSAQAIAAGTTQLPVSRGAVAGSVTLTAGTAAGFPVGSDFSGAVVTLVAPDGVRRSAVTGANGEYRFDDVPVSVLGGSHSVLASKSYFQTSAGSVMVIAHALTPGPLLSLPVATGTLTGSALLWDNVGGAGVNTSSAAVGISLVGAAFNGISWSASGTTAVDGTFTIGNLPSGSYDVVATSANRTCGAYARATLPPGQDTDAGSVHCTDALAPGALSLGAPQAPPGGLSGYTAAGSVYVPMVVQATDATAPQSNLRGYQVIAGSAADWSAATLVPGQPAGLTFTGLVPNAVNLLWARAVDWVGNAGPVAAAQVVTDTIPPPAPAISTPRASVNATTTSVTLSGSDADLNFGGYEISVSSQAATVACPGSPPGGAIWTATSASFPLSLVANQRTCLFARAWDRAGTRSAVTSIGTAGVVGDLTPPTPPVFAPSYDPTQLTVRAPWVDFFPVTASTDAPAGGAPWASVAWIEVDTGSGFTPLCPAVACHPNDTYAPCGCGCTDPRLVCDGARFAAVRAPLQEGSTTSVSFRAVDVAGNVGSGVGQQVVVDSTGDVVAATAALETGPNLRGTLLTYQSFAPGAGNAHGIIVDLGPERRFDALDRRCDVSPTVASGYSRGIFPASPTLVVTAEWGAGARMLRPGADGLFCTGDDVATIFRTPPLNYYVDGISGSGEVVAWWERQNSPGVANLYVREGGADGTFGTGDDPITLVTTYNYMQSITVGQRAILVNQASCGDACYTYRWRVINANASGGYSSATSMLDLPSTATQAGLSADGRELAWLDSNAIWVRSSGPNGVFDPTDDTSATIAIPWPLGYVDLNGLSVDGPHVLLLTSGTPYGYLLHWWAGPDGVFGTADDTLARTHFVNGYPQSTSLASSLATFAEDSDVKLVDLSTLRWEVAPQNGMSSGRALLADRRGNLLYHTASSGWTARASAGTETSGPGYYLAAASGTDLVFEDGAQHVFLYHPNASGTWFGAAAPAPVQIYTAASYVNDLVLGGGKAMTVEGTSNAYRFKILQGNLSSPSVVDALGIDQGWANAYGVTTRQAFFTCDGITTNLCVRTASGPSNTFVPGDPVPIRMRHPVGSPRAGLNIQDARAFLVSGTRMLFAEFSPPALYLVDAGPDGLFATPDDRGRKLADGYFDPWAIALAGRSAAFLTDGSPAGRQVYLVPDFAETPTPVTAHYSTKTSLAIEPGGRMFWVDSVFAPEAVFVREP